MSFPAAIGVRLAEPDPAARVTALIGDGTFLMAPTEIVTAAQERLAVTSWWPRTTATRSSTGCR